MKTGAAAGTDCRPGVRAGPWARAGGQAGDKRLKSPHCWRSIRSLYPLGDRAVSCHNDECVSFTDSMD